MGDENSCLGDVTHAFVDQCLSEYDFGMLMDEIIFQELLSLNVITFYKHCE